MISDTTFEESVMREFMNNHGKLIVYEPKDPDATRWLELGWHGGTTGMCYTTTGLYCSLDCMFRGAVLKMEVDRDSCWLVLNEDTDEWKCMQEATNWRQIKQRDHVISIGLVTQVRLANDEEKLEYSIQSLVAK